MPKIFFEYFLYFFDFFFIFILNFDFKFPVQDGSKLGPFTLSPGHQRAEGEYLFMPTKSTFQSCVCTYFSLYFVVFSFDVFKEFFHTYCCFGQKKSWSERRFWLRTKLFKCFTTLFHDIKRLFLH